MSADGLSIVTLLFPDPKTSSLNDASISVLNASVSFRLDLGTDIRTLSNTNIDVNQDIVGLLYLPELDAGNTCDQEVFKYVSRNATSQIHLPVDAQYTFIAVAPWISATCTSQFLWAARDDPLRAFVFFLPDDKPTVPKADDAVWSLGDGGKWKKANKFPVFAISGQNGGQILHNMALYSGNLTNVPNGQLLADQFPPSSYVRLAGAISMDGRGPLPSLWAFLLIVLGIVLFIIVTTSGAMHFIQKRRRDSLRRRVASGEVDLERLGIKNLTVPRNILDLMPLYTYQLFDKEAASLKDSASLPVPGRATRDLSNQPTCAICLDDFMLDDSLVRELPCGHIFHSECVDTFLRENSSLCPLCKKSSLPSGYCPPVLTQAMVRRERTLRRMREQVSDRQDRQSGPFGKLNPLHWRVFGRRGLTGLEQSATNTGLRSSDNTRGAGHNAANETSTDTDYHSRPEWARQRALDMVAADGNETSLVQHDDQGRPRWRRYMSKVWPGLV